MGCGRPRALRHPAGLDHHDRLDSRGRACRRHELARILDRLDVKQDRLGSLIQREVVEQIGDIDIELVANRNDPGKADGALCRPVHHACGYGAGLRDQRQISCGRHVRGEARIETDAGHHDAQAIRTDQPHAVFVCRPLRLFRHRARAMAEPGTDNDRARRAAAARLIDQACDRARRRGEHNDFGRKSQLGDAAGGRDTIDLVITRIDEAELAFELGFTNIVENGAADRSMARTGSDQRDRVRRKQIFQTIGGHRSPIPRRLRSPVSLDRCSAQCDLCATG